MAIWTKTFQAEGRTKVKSPRIQCNWCVLEAERCPGWQNNVEIKENHENIDITDIQDIQNLDDFRLWSKSERKNCRLWTQETWFDLHIFFKKRKKRKTWVQSPVSLQKQK